MAKTTLLDLLYQDLQDAVTLLKTNHFKFGRYSGGAYALIDEHPTEPNRCCVVDWFGSKEALINQWRDEPKYGKKVARRYYAIRFHKTSRGLQVKEILFYGFWDATEGW